MKNTIFAHLVTLQDAAEPAEATLDVWKLITEASFVVQLVMLALVLMSVACWFIIGFKVVRFFQAANSSRDFLTLFWADQQHSWTTERLESVYAQVSQHQRSPIATVFHSGYVELARVMGTAQEHHGEGDIENVERALRRTAGEELTRMETMLPFLATTGSTGPFIGLFGTVWGIMNSFISIGAMKSASLDVVAPGIAEALIATAIGLAAAIPAVMAYNYFIRRIRVMENELDSFKSDFLNIVRRHFLRF